MVNETGIMDTPVGEAVRPAAQSFESETHIQAINRLFNTDPVKLSDVDIEKICEELRTQRGKFAAEEMANSMKEKKPRVKAVQITKDQAQQLSLEDIGL